jgi:hypothetical protein
MVRQTFYIQHLEIDRKLCPGLRYTTFQAPHKVQVTAPLAEGKVTLWCRTPDKTLSPTV